MSILAHRINSILPLSVLLLLIVGLVGCRNDEKMVVGESFVLSGTIPSRIMCDSLKEQSISLRNTYQITEDTKYYKEGQDFIIDYPTGTIRRTSGSAIPDYSLHPLYGKDNFDESLLGANVDWTNEQYFVYLDYNCKSLPEFRANNQTSYLKQTRDKLQSGNTLKLVWYGNSITAGGGTTHAQWSFTNRYEKYLKKQFPQAQIQSVNLSIPGYGTPEAVSWFDGIFKDQQPDIVFIGFGMNDQCMEGNSSCSNPTVFEENLVMLANKIKTLFGADVVFFSAFPPNEQWKHNTHRMEQYAAASRQAAIATNSAYVDVFGTWQQVLKRKDQQSLLANNINHPNDFGHWIYEQAFEAMQF